MFRGVWLLDSQQSAKVKPLSDSSSTVKKKEENLSTRIELGVMHSACLDHTYAQQGLFSHPYSLDLCHTCYGLLRAAVGHYSAADHYSCVQYFRR